MKKLAKHHISNWLSWLATMASLYYLLYQWFRYFQDFDDLDQGELVAFIVFIGGYCLVLLILILTGWCLHFLNTWLQKTNKKTSNIYLAIYCALFVTFFVATSQSISDQEQFLPENMLLAFISLVVVVTSQKLFDSSTQKQLRLISEKERKQAELNTLKAQVNPHFLFNALNTLYNDALKINASELLENLEKLTDILRYQLSSAALDGIPLEREVAFIHQFVTFQQHRLGENAGVRIKINTTIESFSLEIQPMILISLIENAFKHGISHEQLSTINISLKEKKGILLLTIENSNNPKTGKESSGIGLSQTRKLLHAYYHTYKLDTYLENDRYHTELTIDLNDHQK